MISILLVDDHAILREGVRTLLEGDPSFRVVGEATDGPEALRLVEQLKPDIVVLDLQLPGMSGLEVLQQIKLARAESRVVVLSMHINEAYVLQAVREGALGYLLKGASATELAEAITRAAAGQRYLSPPLSDVVIEAYARKVAPSEVDRDETLTARERQVLRWAAEGLTNTQVGDRLSISPRTAEAHRAKVMHKLGLKSQTELVRYANRGR